MKNKIFLYALVVFTLVFITVNYFVFDSEKVSCEGSGVVGDIANKDFFDSAYKNISKDNIKQEARGAIVNHHLLAANLIANVFESFSNKNSIKTVYLISPNHFYSGHYPVEVYTGIFETPYGNLCSNKEVAGELLKEDFVSEEKEVFIKEHGLYNIAPFIKKSFPNARIVAVAVKENAKIDQLQKIANIIKKDKDAVVIGSFDFSHTLNVDGANFHDAKSLDAIESFDTERVLDLDIDSMKGLYLVMKIVEGEHEIFNLFTHTNSAYVSDDLNAQDVTSYITGIFTKGLSDRKAKTHTILFFDNTEMYKGDKSIPRLLMGNDAVIESKEELKTYIQNKGFVWDEFLDRYSGDILGIVYTNNEPKYYNFPYDIIKKK